MKYQVWAVHANGPDELIEVFDHEYEASFVCNELNIASTDFDGPVPDYRVCAVPLYSKENI